MDPGPHCAERSCAAITNIAFETGDNNPVMAVSFADGDMQMYNLTLWHGDKVISGRRPRAKRIQVTDDKTNKTRMKVVKPTPP